MDILSEERRRRLCPLVGMSGPLGPQTGALPAWRLNISPECVPRHLSRWETLSGETRGPRGPS